MTQTRMRQAWRIYDDSGNRPTVAFTAETPEEAQSVADELNRAVWRRKTTLPRIIVFVLFGWLPWLLNGCTLGDPHYVVEEVWLLDDEDDDTPHCDKRGR